MHFMGPVNMLRLSVHSRHLFYLLPLKYNLFFRASPEGRIGVSIYTGEGCHLGGIIGIPWSGSESGLGVHVAAIRGSFVVFAAVVAAV